MGWGVKIKAEDTLFSDLVRELAGWKCARCGRQHIPYENTMDCSHYYGRGKQSVRFDLENADALCRYPCHQGSDSTDASKFGWEYQKGIKGWHGHQVDGAYTAYMKKKLGEKGFDLLTFRAHQTFKKRTKIEIKELREELREKLKSFEKYGG
jgi:hypothetical protein